MKDRSVTSLEELPEPRLLGGDIKYLHGNITNRRFSATASILSSFESSKLTKDQKGNVLRSTPILTISNYDEEQDKVNFIEY
jgi:hypothetical protein